MNKKISTLLARIISAALLAAYLVTPAAHAAPNGLYLNPTTGTYGLNSTFTSQIRFGGSTSGVRANLTFDTSRLTITGTSNSGSAFSNISVNYDNTDGTISALSTSAANGSDNLVTTITFKTIGSGNANVTFTGSNQRADINLLLLYTWSDTSTTSAVYTVSPAATTSPSPAPVQGGGGTGSTGTQGQAHNPSSPSQTVKNPSVSPPATNPQTDAQPIEPLSPTSQSSEKQKTSRGVSDPGSALPTPDEPYSIPVTIEPKNKSPFAYLPIVALAGTFALVSTAIIFAYRKAHPSHSLRSLMAAASLKTSPAVAPVSHKLSSLAPKLLVYTSPKLLASGIKKRLLLTSGKKTPSAKS